MKISNKLPQFEDKPTLLVVAGWQSGKIFYAFNGEVELDKELDVPDHKYSDKEGHFKRSTAGVGDMGSGSVLEKKKEHIRKEFLRLFIDYIKSRVRKNKIKSIYLFSPAEGLGSLEKKLPNDLKDLIESFYTGNYIKHGPQDLINIIEEKKSKPVQVMSEEAKKILEKGE